MDPNRLEFSMKIQDMLAKIEKRISKYLKYLKQCIAFFGSIFLHVSIWSFYSRMWQMLHNIRKSEISSKFTIWDPEVYICELYT